ncbi:unnamed protein product [Gemmataceae bacterium]|nr:unnamed protein product [Gemmataceae bacterium]VTU02087.1 unnamed protein product [Gemmataceae bacterium]
MDSTELAALVLAAMAFIAGVVVGRASAVAERRRGGAGTREREGDRPLGLARPAPDRSGRRAGCGVQIPDTVCPVT